jgi:hypothetical protein
MWLCERAGIDITKKAIWRNAALILRELPADASPEVRTWLARKLAGSGR